MKKSLLAQPDAFSIAPLLTLLPVAGEVSKLEPYASAFFARYDQVKSLRHFAETSGDSVMEQRYAVEEAMLRQVLDWLAIKPE